ncbi:hypothetical protein OCF64_27735 [Bacillus wiedmannii]|uniref:hypothetical protein n=1 Tax=Bacillus wiedmannii TaxID=1890302 RepID=UPI0021D14862|nr:hypothetical protein [Bacillus wiedmannii]MCU5685505.1 hypothetical protein [Bacillus wiedmannii]
MNTKQLISLEELVFLLNSTNNTAYAKELLSIAYNELTEKELEIIVSTVSHSLLTRNLITYDQHKEEIDIQPDLKQWLNIINNPSTVLLLQKIDIENTTTTTGNIYFSDKTIIGYQSLNGITHQIQKINNEQLYVESKTLLQLTIKEDHLQNKKYGSISTDLIKNIQKLITLPSQESIKILTAHDFDIKSAEEFIQDLKTTKNIYSVIKLETKDNKEITSDNGFFIIETKGKQWLFSQNEQNDGTLSLTNLNDVLFEQKINQLLNNR